ncbi:hypothetical protein BpHYR1_031327 [Brachionus plicatilis]|uniref:Uncharacterized protein n=1 Tax=Brachionus plicatilis TaxID=10195 RepID=A0A3M7QRS2_BRAPC|nr:hypothetical protein BpHYR1_031327 [Brachionus plicatilis]
MLKVFNRGNKSQLTDSDSPDPRPQTSNYRRQASLRHSHYFGHTENYATLGSLKQGGKANLINSKKYISCENVRQSAEEYQDVIDEDSTDDENGFKEKIAKRYNSLTTLLMKSFRKAKIKKKKEAMMNDSARNEIFRDKSARSPRLHAERHNPSRSNDTPMLPPRHDNCRKNKSPEPEVASQSIATISRNQPVSKKKICHAENQKGSDENKKIDHDEPESDGSEECADGSVPVFLGAKIISNEFVELKPSVRKNTEPKISQLSEKKTNSEIKSEFSGQSGLSKTNIDGINDSSFEKKASDSPRIAISSANKPQAPKPPVQLSKNDSISGKRSLSLKRAKTFTEQLQEILLERKRASAQPPKENPKEEVKETSILESSSYKCSNKTLGYYDTINSTKSLYQNLDDSNYIKQIKNFNDSSMLKDSLVSELSFSNYSNDDSCDDFKDLVQVLARQDNLFKKKFFDCLMTKLWDTTLPYNEYLQLNKLMSALFGENYHKLDTSFLNSCSQSKTSKLNSEQVVNLVKMFLDSNKSENLPSAQNEELNFEYFSVANLISTLKRRQKKDTLSLEVDKFNSHLDTLLNTENKGTRPDPNFELERINFLNGINTKQNTELDKDLMKKNQDNYFSRNRFRNTMGNLDSILAQYTSGPTRPLQTISADSAISFPGVKFSTLQRDEPRPSIARSIMLNTPAKSSGIIASFQPSQFISQDLKRNPVSVSEVPQTFIASKVISLNKQCPPKPKISISEKEAMNVKMSKIRSVRELFKNDENPDNFPKKNEITMVKAENLVYAQFENNISKARLPSTKSLLSSSVDNKTLNKSISSPYTTAKKLHLQGIYSTLGPKKDSGDIIYYHPNQFKLNCVEKSKQVTCNRNPKDSRIYESKSTKSYQLSNILADKIYNYNSREMNQAYY